MEFVMSRSWSLSLATVAVVSCSACLAGAAETLDPRELLIAAKEAVWLEDYAQARTALRQLQRALRPEQAAILAPFVQPFKVAASEKRGTSLRASARSGNGPRRRRRRARWIRPPRSTWPCC
jgi:hypothetical protein